MLARLFSRHVFSISVQLMYETEQEVGVKCYLHFLHMFHVINTAMGLFLGRPTKK